MTTQGFKPGRKKTGGRQKGSLNIVTKETQEVLMQALSGEVQNIKTALTTVRKQDPVKYLEIISRLLPFIVPKLQDVTIEDTRDLLPAVEINVVSGETANRLKKYLEDGPEG